MISARTMLPAVALRDGADRGLPLRHTGRAATLLRRARQCPERGAPDERGLGRRGG